MKDSSQVQKRVDDLLDKIKLRFRIKINPDDYPSVHLSTKNNSSYSPTLNYINLREEDLNDSDVLGEDAIAHPLRTILRQYAAKRKLEQEKSSWSGRLKATFGKHYPEKPDFEEDDPEVAEFFGYIGRKMMQKVTKPEDSLVYNKKRRLMDTPQSYKNHHEIGYQFAKQIDLSKIQDFQRFFELPKEEVRARFFRPDPQYDFSIPVPQAQITRRHQSQKQQPPNLETMLKTIIPILLIIISIPFITQKAITGNVINESIINKSLPILAILVISLIFFIAIGLKRRKN